MFDSYHPKFMKTLVMKFGGASVASPEHFAHIADLIIERQCVFPRLVIVVSAMGQTTNELIKLAHQVHPNPPQREYDMLISAGERISMTLLAMILCRKGKDAVSFTGSQSGILTCSQHTSAHIIDVRPQRLIQTLEQGKIVIVAGFQGVSQDKEVTTLGRGGSDTSAVAIGVALKAEKIEFYKDVLGIYNKDPKMYSDAICYPTLNYQEALTIVNQGAKVLHARAIKLAEKNGMPLHVRSFISRHDQGTWITSVDCKKSINPVYEIS
ncbi:Aspartokinase 2 [Candidatus Protochlamydia amoebophila]|uniref:aspartate kinase n=2 Tax=Candidatus Protochlamydia amoebophila TaxID=362787 RepID=A0A0C1H4F7_9BACT|nr:Aspartokinase 2 [Candidatus Protochlamydia amoebophila]